MKATKPKTRTIVRTVTAPSKPRIVEVAEQIAAIQKNRVKLESDIEKHEAAIEQLTNQADTLNEEQRRLEREMDSLTRADHPQG